MTHRWVGCFTIPGEVASVPPPFFAITDPMNLFLRYLQRWALAVCLLGLSMGAHALTMAQARGMVDGDTDARLQVLNQALQQADAASAAYLQALADDQVKFSADTVWVVRDGSLSARSMVQPRPYRPTPKTWSATTACAVRSTPPWRP